MASSLSKVILALGQARRHTAPNLGCREAEPPGWFDVSQKISAQDVVHVSVLSWWSCQSPVAHSSVLLNHLNSFHGGMFKINPKFDADSLLYLLSHFECDGHTVHMLTQKHLPPPLTTTVKSSLLTRALSSPLSLAARLHQCHTNHSRCINDGWTFSGTTSIYIYTPTHKDFASSLTTRLWDLIILGLKNFIFSYNKVKFYTLQFIYFPLTYFLRIQIFDTLRHGLDILIKPTTKGAIVFFNLTLSHLSITLFFPIQEFPKPFPHSLSHWHEAQTPASIFWGPTNSKGDIVSASQTSQVGLKTTLWTMHELPNLTKMKLKEFYVQGHIDN